MPRSSYTETLDARAMRRATLAHHLLGETRTAREVGDRNLPERLQNFVAVLRAIANVVVVELIFLHHHA